MRTFVAALVLVAFGAVPALGQPAQRCSKESFPVAGQTVAVTVCAPPAEGRSVAVTESFKGTGGAFSHASSIEILPGASVSRGVDDVSLSPLGLQYTMHLTLAYRDGNVAIEHALLLPGAVPLK